jgi:hypothetical protein
LRFLGRVEVEVDDDVLGVVDWPVDAVLADPWHGSSYVLWVVLRR